jgi:shikimate kinase
MLKNIYFLTGFMAAGKSTIAPILANTLGWQFYDLDREIEKKASKKIVELFKERGEKYFRQIESETLVEIASGNNLIISLGGGTLLNNENVEFIRTTGKLIYLKSSVTSIFNRLKNKRDRPALFIDGEFPDDDQLYQKIEKMMNERKLIYEKADVTIDTDVTRVGKSVDILAKIITKNIS